MNNRAFSKIWILIIVVILAGGGILAWQSFGVPKEEIKAPEGATKDEFVKVNENLAFDKFGFSLSLPDSWEVEIEEQREKFISPYKGFSFSFIPPEGILPGWSFWGGLNMQTHEAQPNIKEWIEKYLPNFKDDLVAIEKGPIGGKPVFSVEVVNKEVFWTPRFVVLGTEYSYSFGFFQDGADDFVARIIEEIFPNIRIK